MYYLPCVVAHCGAIVEVTLRCLSHYCTYGALPPHVEHVRLFTVEIIAYKCILSIMLYAMALYMHISVLYARRG